MKTREEILDQVNFFITPEKKQQILVAMEEYATQCQEDMADEIKEVYEQGLSDGYACMPSTISPLNKQD